MDPGTYALFSTPYAAIFIGVISSHFLRFEQLRSSRGARIFVPGGKGG